MFNQFKNNYSNCNDLLELKSLHINKKLFLILAIDFTTAYLNLQTKEPQSSAASRLFY